jgi:aspartyl-tRNA synthetase
MLMAAQTSIKEVIAFPKNSFAQSPMDDCPGEIEQKQLNELHIMIRKDSSAQDLPREGQAGAGMP